MLCVIIIICGQFVLAYSSVVKEIFPSFILLVLSKIIDTRNLQYRGERAIAILLQKMLLLFKIIPNAKNACQCLLREQVGLSCVCLVVILAYDSCSHSCSILRFMNI